MKAAITQSIVQVKSIIVYSLDIAIPMITHSYSVAISIFNSALGSVQEIFNGIVHSCIYTHCYLKAAWDFESRNNSSATSVLSREDAINAIALRARQCAEHIPSLALSLESSVRNIQRWSDDPSLIAESVSRGVESGKQAAVKFRQEVESWWRDLTKPLQKWILMLVLALSSMYLCPQHRGQGLQILGCLLMIVMFFKLSEMVEWLMID